MLEDNSKYTCECSEGCNAAVPEIAIELRIALQAMHGLQYFAVIHNHSQLTPILWPGSPVIYGHGWEIVTNGKEIGIDELRISHATMEVMFEYVLLERSLPSSLNQQEELQ